MNELARLMRDRYPGQTYQDIAGVDGALPPQLREQRNPPQATADISFERYTSPDFFDREMEKMWMKVWQFACREENLPEVGDYYVYDIGRRSVVIVRSKDGLKAFHNSCLHRGTKLKPSGTHGWSPSIQCPYHAWEWNLDGSNRNIPCAWEFPHLDAEAKRLREVKVDSWNGCVFVNFDSDAKPLLDYLEVLPAHFATWDMTGWYAHVHVRKRLPGNWKLAQDAFLEAYHTPIVHPEMTLTVSDQNMQHDILSDHVTRDLCAMASPSPTAKISQTQQELLDTMVMGDRSVVAERLMVPEGKTARWVMANQLRRQMAEQYGLDYSGHSVPEMIDSLKYTVFPNLFVEPAPGFPLILTFRPDGHDPDRSLFDVMVMRPQPTDGSQWEPAEPIVIEEDGSYCDVPGFDPLFGRVLDQDTSIMRWQREGMYASGKGAQSLSIYQEARIRHIHDMIDRYLAR